MWTTSRTTAADSIARSLSPYLNAQPLPNPEYMNRVGRIFRDVPQEHPPLFNSPIIGVGQDSIWFSYYPF